MAIVKVFTAPTPDGSQDVYFFPGVPFGDLDDTEWATYPAWLQDSIANWPAYSVAPTPIYEEPEEP